MVDFQTTPGAADSEEEIGSEVEPLQGVGSDAMDLNLRIVDREVVEVLEQFEDPRLQHEYALRALRIGVLALQKASGQLDVEAIKREGEQVVKQLESRATTLRDGIKSELERYFDPKNGQLPQRVESLIKKDGELETLLSRYVSAEDSVLTQSLSKLVGEGSPLRHYLDPDNKQGLVEHLRTLQEQAQKQILDEFSTDLPESALSRLLAKLREENADVTKELNLNNDESALNRMMRKVESAQKTIVAEFSLDNDDSALKRMLIQLEGELKKQRDAGEKFQTEVRATLESMQARKQERAKGTGHGLDFEAAVYEWLKHHCDDHVVDSTGNTTGRLKNSKVGDVVVEINKEHRAAGATIVFEAKKDQGYNLQRALTEIETARKNREAEIGVFIFAKATAPSGQAAFSRHGDDLVIVWDHEDDQSHVYLKAAWSVATALASKARDTDDGSADRKQMDAAIGNIEKRLGNLDEIRTWAQTVESNGKKIVQQTETMRKAIERELGSLRGEVDKLDA